MIQSWQTVLYRINAGILYRLFLLIEQQLFLTRCFPGSSFLHWLNSWLFRRCFPEWSFFAEWTAWWFRHPTFTWLTSRRLFAATFWNFGHTGDRTPDPLCRKPCALVHFATRLLSLPWPCLPPRCSCRQQRPSAYTGSGPFSEIKTTALLLCRH